jgi:copper chaperone
MLEFNIPALSCGHCVRAVNETVHSVDPQAGVQVDLQSKQVQVQTHAERDLVVAALAEAGYPPH